MHMKKFLVFLLSAVMLLSLCACSSKIKKELCEGCWESSDHILEDDRLNIYREHFRLTFFEDGTCLKEVRENGKVKESEMLWKIQGGRIAVFSENADYKDDYVWHELEDGVLKGSAWYDSEFTYVHIVD